MPSIVLESSQSLLQPNIELQVEEGDSVGKDLTKVHRFYGWVILPLAMFAMFATSPGQTFGVSIFNEPMRESLKLRTYPVTHLCRKSIFERRLGV
jgi:hypothetical protein